MAIVIPNKIEDLKTLLDTLPTEKVEYLRDEYFYKGYIIENNKERNWNREEVDFYLDRYLFVKKYIENKYQNKKENN